MVILSKYFYEIYTYPPSDRIQENSTLLSYLCNGKADERDEDDTAAFHVAEGAVRNIEKSAKVQELR